MKIKLTKKNLKNLEKGFTEAPKTYEESLKTGRFVPFEKGTKFKDLDKTKE